MKKEENEPPKSQAQIKETDFQVMNVESKLR